jgi:predicted dehydrogenase
MYGTEGSFCREGGVLTSYDIGPDDERKRMMDLFSATPKEAALKADPMALSSDGHTLIIEDLVRAVQEDGEPMIPLSQAKHAVEVATAIYKSGRTGRVISVDTVRR